MVVPMMQQHPVNLPVLSELKNSMKEVVDVYSL